MPQTDKDGNLEFHPLEMPPDFESAADPNNPFIRKQFESVATTRPCKICGKRFTLGVPYDKDNPGHDLCEDCILAMPGKQNYPEKTIQLEQMELDAQPQESSDNGEDLSE
jgi:hypothetical protein